MKISPTESVVFGVVLGASMLLLVAATPIKNLVFQGNADAGGYQITNLATGTNASNASTKSYVDAAAGSLSANLSVHTASTTNPHSVTKAQVGLGNVENTALTTWTGGTNIARVGTITNGTWAGNVIPLTKGGTGQPNGLLAENISDATATGRALLKVIVYGPLNSDQAFVYNFITGIVTTTDMTGSGKAVRNTSPTLIAPVLGAATATSLNKLAITAPATGATLTISDNKTLSVGSNITLGSDGNGTRTLNIGTGGTLGSAAYVAATNFLTPTGDGSRLTGVAKEGIYPVIWIPLPPGSQWTDFELKASTDNFVTMAYWYHSPDPSKATLTEQVWTNRPDVFFTDSGKTGTPNQRAWIRQNATQSIFAMLTDANSEVGGFIIVIKDDLSAYRDRIVFSYSLLDASTADNDPANRGVWRPAWPQQWVNTFNPTP